MDWQGPTIPYDLPRLKPQRRRWLTPSRIVLLVTAYILLLIATAMIVHAFFSLVP